VVGDCPICGSKVIHVKSNYFCTNNDCKFSLWGNDIIWKKFKKTITETRAKAILKNKEVKVKNVGTFKLVINEKGSKYLTSWKIDFENNQKKG
jgi:DNA topoisomerase-3